MPEVISAFGLGLVTDKLPNSIWIEAPVLVPKASTSELAPILVTEMLLLAILTKDVTQTIDIELTIYHIRTAITRNTDSGYSSTYRSHHIHLTRLYH